MADENELNGSFEESSSNVHRRVGHIAVTYKHYILVWGGFMSGPDDVELYCPAKNIWFYNCSTEVWTVKTTKGCVPFPNSGSTAVIIDDYLYIYGGVEGLTDGFWRFGCELHCLDLKKLTWTTLMTSGKSPKGSDKAVGWAYDKKLYLFGGYGQYSQNTNNIYTFEVDPSNHLDKGWNNQLSIYEPSANEWITAKTKGVPPRPRAAHAADLSGHNVVIFGGRLAETRASDMYILDLKNLSWNQIHIKDGTSEIPEGRSWHSFNFISEKRAIVFGGLNRDQAPCGDWWECEIDGNEVTWQLKGNLPKVQTLVWHKAVVSSVTKELIIIGGITCSPYQMKEENHVDKLHVLPYTPASLLRLSLQEIAKKGQLLQLLNEEGSLPKILRELVKAKTEIQNSVTNIYNVEQISVIN